VRACHRDVSRHEVAFRDLVLDSDDPARIGGPHSNDVFTAPFNPSNPTRRIILFAKIRRDELVQPADIAGVNYLFNEPTNAHLILGLGHMIDPVQLPPRA